MRSRSVLKPLRQLPLRTLLRQGRGFLVLLSFLLPLLTRAEKTDTIRIITRESIKITSAPDENDEQFPDAFADSITPGYERKHTSGKISHHHTPDSASLITLTSITRIETRKEPEKWWRRLISNKFDLNDTTISYPRFIGFCMNVYRWADKAFNSYDNDYVVGTGRRWKAYLKNDNLLDSYAMNFDRKMPIRMMSNMTSNIGPYLQYMAVSVGYQWNINNLLTSTPMNRQRLEFGFSCARFNAEFIYWSNTGGNVIRTFGNYNNGHLIYAPISGVEMGSLGIDIYYFLNNRRYSQMAAYGFGKIQKRSQGSFIFGLSYGNQNIKLDFTTLPAYLLPYLNITEASYHFHYKNYCAIAGYGYNWVLSKHFLYNITVLPSVGLNHCYEDSVEGAVNIFSMNLKGKMAVAYNKGDFFAGVNTNFGGHWYRTTRYSLFNSAGTFSACIGCRF